MDLNEFVNLIRCYIPLFGVEKNCTKQKNMGKGKTLETNLIDILKYVKEFLTFPFFNFKTKQSMHNSFMLSTHTAFY